MIIKIMSQNDCRVYDRDCAIEGKKIAIISINNTWDQIPEFKNRALYLTFDDVELSDNYNTAMSMQDANKIIEFVNAVKDSVDELIVHCMAGISRSSGTAAALMLLYNNDDTPVFNNGKYSPNMRCYRFVLNAGGLKPSFSEINTKLETNTELFRKEQDLD